MLEEKTERKASHANGKAFRMNAFGRVAYYGITSPEPAGGGA